MMIPEKNTPFHFNLKTPPIFFVLNINNTKRNVVIPLRDHVNKRITEKNVDIQKEGSFR